MQLAVHKQLYQIAERLAKCLGSLSASTVQGMLYMIKVTSDTTNYTTPHRS